MKEITEQVQEYAPLVFQCLTSTDLQLLLVAVGPTDRLQDLEHVEHKRSDADDCMKVGFLLNKSDVTKTAHRLYNGSLHWFWAPASLCFYNVLFIILGRS